MLKLRHIEHARAHRLVVMVRLLIYTILPLISLGFLWKFEPSSKLIPLVGLIALAILINLGQLVSRKQWAPPFRGSMFSWVPDLIVVTGIVHYTGGPISDFWFLFALVILAGGFARGVWGSLAAGVASSVVYAVMMYLSIKGIVTPVLPPDPIMLQADWAPTIALKTFLHITFFLLTAAIVGYMTERFQRKQGELDVKTSELDQLRLDTNVILETIPTGILACDFSKEILYFNRAGTEILEISGNMLRHGSSITTYLQPRPEIYQIVSKFVEEGLPTRQVELEIPLSNGDIRPIGIDANYLIDREGGKRGIVIYFNDLTEAKAIARQKRISDRLSAVGELSRDLAHEIRNPLAVIRGSVEFLSRELHPGGQMERLMDGIMRESDRLNTLIYEFLDFSRLSPPETKVVPVKEIIRSLIDMAKSTGDGKVINGTETQTTCLADFDQLLRSLDTLIKEIKRLNQSTSAAEILVAEPEENFEVFPKENIQIPRNQVGFVLRFPNLPLPEQDIDDLFRPFHHSDPKHRGLGLCTAHRIIESHKGEIRVVNRPQQGLALLVLMPSSTAQADDIALTSHEKSILEVEPA